MVYLQIQLLICTATAAIILLSGKYDQSINGIELTQVALHSEIGVWGHHIVAVAIFLFSFTTIIANYYYYSEANLIFIFKDKTPNKIISFT